MGRLSLSTIVIKILFVLIIACILEAGAEPVDDSAAQYPGEIKRDREGCLKILKIELIPMVDSPRRNGKKVVSAINKSLEAVNAKLIKHKKECEKILREKY